MLAISISNLERIVWEWVTKTENYKQKFINGIAIQWAKDIVKIKWSEIVLHMLVKVSIWMMRYWHRRIRYSEFCFWIFLNILRDLPVDPLEDIYIRNPWDLFRFAFIQYCQNQAWISLVPYVEACWTIKDFLN